MAEWTDSHSLAMFRTIQRLHESLATLEHDLMDPENKDFMPWVATDIEGYARDIVEWIKIRNG